MSIYRPIHSIVVDVRLLVRPVRVVSLVLVRLCVLQANSSVVVCVQPCKLTVTTVVRVERSVSEDNSVVAEVVYVLAG